MTRATMLSEADHLRVSHAVREAEGGTAGEIVTIITEASDRYIDIALWWSVLVAMIVLAGCALFPALSLGLIDRLTDSWSVEWTPGHILEFALAATVIAFAITRALLFWRPLLLLLTPGWIQAERVRGRAIRYFKVGAERRTQGRTGILIYLSLDEHRAEIVADEAIHAKVADEVWGEAMAKLIVEARRGYIADGMIAAIGDVGLILAAHFPRAPADLNELPDRLIEL